MKPATTLPGKSHSLCSALLLTTGLLFAGSPLSALELQRLPPPGQQRAASGHEMVLDLKWAELLPEKERNRARFSLPPRHNFLDESGPPPPQFMSFAVNKDLEGLIVRLSGFVVPIELDDKGRVLSFFLVPYFGACIHLPPPPPNQIVYVTPPKAFMLPSLYAPYSVSGKLTTGAQSNRLGASAYTLAGTEMTTYNGE